jgi:molybdopterin-containing oxidoreductase family iron-sulfur binding subunit
MVIDLNRCIGCSACVIACQSENNIPIVGREMTARSREMHWMRLDRYYTGSAESPRSVVQPMLCQHCESAPCESVCPVNATVHDAQGLNVMVYNRCVGSRYCSNNCPFKVRRFNFFDYNRNSLNRLHDSPLSTKTDGEWGLKHWLKNPDRGSLSEADFEISKLYKNPEVTVRMRGIMEKCSFCQHRLQRARENQLIQAGNSNVTKIPADHLPQTACQQACPTRAIEFGDATDLQSPLSKWKSNQRNYALFDTLNLIPRVTYLARICNPNPEMPDQKGVAL